MHKKRRSFLFQFLFSFFFITGIVFIVLGFNEYEIIEVGYKENSDINYKVYLKENSFFEDKYLEENKTYIASLIDYIDVNFHYNISYNMPLKGDYNYKLVAIVSSNKQNSDEYYWKKSYDLTEVKTGTYESNSSLLLDENIKIDYSKYNQILNSFRKEYPFASTGNLQVAMEVNNNILTEYDENPILLASNVNLSIPLLEQTVEASISKNTKNTSDVFKFKVNDDSLIYLVYKILGFILTALSIAYFSILIIIRLFYRKNNKYEVFIDKILKNYDSIIVDTNSEPSFSDFKIIKVDSFDELLDVYNEVRMPINYYRMQSRCIFAVYNDTIVWIYELNKEEFI